MRMHSRASSRANSSPAFRRHLGIDRADRGADATALAVLQVKAGHLLLSRRPPGCWSRGRTASTGSSGCTRPRRGRAGRPASRRCGTRRQFPASRIIPPMGISRQPFSCHGLSPSLLALRRPRAAWPARWPRRPPAAVFAKPGPQLLGQAPRCRRCPWPGQRRPAWACW